MTLKTGDRVCVTDSGLAQLRAIMRQATGHEPSPNNHGTIDAIVDGWVYINFDDGGQAPYPITEVSPLTGQEATDA